MLAAGPCAFITSLGIRTGDLGIRLVSIQRIREPVGRLATSDEWSLVQNGVRVHGDKREDSPGVGGHVIATRDEGREKVLE